MEGKCSAAPATSTFLLVGAWKVPLFVPFGSCSVSVTASDTTCQLNIDVIRRIILFVIDNINETETAPDRTRLGLNY